jgi:hypothetical protein
LYYLFLGQQQQQQQQPIQQQQQPMQQPQQSMQQQPMQPGGKGREVIWAGELCWHENSNPGLKQTKRFYRYSKIIKFGRSSSSADLETGKLRICRKMSLFQALILAFRVGIVQEYRWRTKKILLRGVKLSV